MSAPSAAQCLEWDTRYFVPGTTRSCARWPCSTTARDPRSSRAGTSRAPARRARRFVAKWDGTRVVVARRRHERARCARSPCSTTAAGPRCTSAARSPTRGGVQRQPHRANGTARAWSALGTGMSQSGDTVRALAVFDDGGGTALYAGGIFTSAGGRASTASRAGTAAIGRRSAARASTARDVLALAVFDDGAGPALFAGGQFVDAGGVSADRHREVGRDELVGARQRDRFDAGDFVAALGVFDDGSRAALYVGRRLLDGGRSRREQHREVERLGVVGARRRDERSPCWYSELDDGSGCALRRWRFLLAGGASHEHVAQWDGSAWSGLEPAPSQRCARSVRSTTAADRRSTPAATC